MTDWYENIRKRREKQVQLIKQGLYSSVKESNLKEQDFSIIKQKKPMKKKKENKTHKWLIQLAISLFLLCGTYFIFHVQTDRGKQLQQWIAQVMTEEFQFKQVSAWYKEVIGEAPSILPVFQTKPKRVALYWNFPVKGKVVLPFDQKRKGLVLQAPPQAQVMAATEGWVSFVGEKTGLGRLVIIRHAQGYESWYGFLKNTAVNEKDWVKNGQVIGEGGEKYIYFAVKKDGQFISPVGVIPFE
ncbi:M23 family metallopeptidase [Thermoflavimicrobium dichotomicum]|uniref:Peptidase family M23 n=1 Tax=Thermoflavimicrobium dichotomicum TaxID=46223 RepID=A0A1I3R8V9_9BACL|nr:M23 family metallopeptidase [Thermoflavimicrobium dichotomicum]SFJ41787.1 Peptidase family M23 [Thermoflavimicrobium dichotomicum]